MLTLVCNVCQTFANPYATLIEVAAPYSSGQAAIFVAARIVFVQELPEQNLFRYGVQYLHADRPRGAS